MISRMQLPREMYGNGGLTSLREARSILERHAPMGEFLAYINSDEAALLKSRGGSGEVANESGIKSYGFLKKVFKPVAKVLDKIVPNEIKPFLPYIAAAIPFVGPAMSATLAGLSATQLAAVSAGANAFSQLSQEGAAERGLNPISLGLSALSGYTAGAGLQAPGAATAGNVVGNVPDYYGLASQPVTSAGVGDLISAANIPTGFQGPLSTGDLGITAPTFGQQVSNLGGSTTEFLGKLSRPGMESIDRIATDPFTASGGDYLKAATALTPGQVAAAGEQAYNAALDAQKKYEQELLAMGNLAGANKQDQINYIRRAMVSAGFNEDEISSAISRSGFMYGGNVEEGFAQGGLMALRMGGMPAEMDLRKGGFVPLGKKERADDVPARLSKNEFVFTAKAVRNAGGGDVRKGAKRMYQIMNQLEARA
jgi:alkylhydroperoxidase/carboxymuconolactone decarboxylase family protein YurZ